MLNNATVVIGDAGSGSPIKFLFNPETQNANGTLQAQIIEEFDNRFELEILNFEIDAQFSNVGPIQIVLDPNLDSTMTVYKLNSNNQVSGTHQANLNLIVQTPDQNLVFQDVLLESETATLSLANPLPVTGFLFQGNAMEINITNLQLTLEPGLVIGDFDPQ